MYMRKQQLELLIYRFAVLAVAIILLWIGVFKFTRTEAEAIMDLVENHPLMSWLYRVFSVQGVSNLIGIVEILIGIGLVFALKFARLGLYVGVGCCVVFLVTLSFLATTPGTWRIVEGVPICNFFILKDLGYLAIGAWVAVKGINT